MQSAERSAARPALPAEIERSGIIAIGRRLDPGRVVGVATTLVDAGVPALELTLNEPRDAVLRDIERLVPLAASHGLLVGAGTVLSIAAAAAAVSAGARFLVTPHTDPELIRWAANYGIPMIAGALSATEVIAAWDAGAAAVKLFPASQAGVTGLRELRGPLPDIPLVPTGGVTLDAIEAFMAAGAVAVGLGGALLGGDPNGLRSRAAAAVQAVAVGRAARR